jgi:peptidyl-prolyl cis-trans isomerase C
MHRLPSPALSLRPALFALLLALPFAAQAAETAKQPAASPATAANDPVVLKVNGKDIHRSEIAQLQHGLGPQAAKMSLDEFYQQISDRLIVNTLLTDAAKAAKLDNDPDVKAANAKAQDELKAELARAQEQIVTRTYVSHLEAKAVTDDALKALYDKTIKTQAGKPEVHARHILVKTEDEAKAIIADLDKGGDFAKLADEKSTDKGENGGDLGWFGKEQMVPEFSDAAFKLGKGEYTKTPVKSQFGWHVIKVEDTRVSPPPTFEEAKPKLREELGQKAVEEKVKDLRAKAKIEQFALDGSPMPAGPALAPGPAPAPAPAAK